MELIVVDCTVDAIVEVVAFVNVLEVVDVELVDSPDDIEAVVAVVKFVAAVESVDVPDIDVPPNILVTGDEVAVAVFESVCGDDLLSVCTIVVPVEDGAPKLGLELAALNAEKLKNLI